VRVCQSTGWQERPGGRRILSAGLDYKSPFLPWAGPKDLPFFYAGKSKKKRETWKPRARNIKNGIVQPRTIYFFKKGIGIDIAIEFSMLIDAPLILLMVDTAKDSYDRFLPMMENSA
jgi:hypothetical protein